MSFTDSGNGYDPYAGFEDLLKQREKTGPAKQSDPIPGIAHGAITGILGVDSSGAPANKASPPGLWSPDNPDVATPDFSIARRDPRSFFPRTPPKRGPLVDDAPPKEFIWPAIQGPADDPKVQQDQRLSSFPTRTDTPENTPLNGGLLKTPFGPGMGLANPGAPGAPPPAPFPGTQPPIPPPAQPQPAPQPVARPPGPPPAQPSMAPPGPQTAPAPAPAAPTPGKDIAGVIPSDSLLGRVLGGTHNWLGQHSNMLMALGAGMMGSQSLGQGLGRGATMALQGNQLDQANASSNVTASLLMQKNPSLTQDQALAMARNPEIMKQVIPGMFGAKARQHVMMKDAFGNETPASFDPVSGKYYDMNGREMGGGGQGGDAGAGAMAAAGRMPENYDPQTGRDEKFIQALDPITRSSVEGILRGDASAAGRNMQKFLPYAMRAEQNFSQEAYDTRKRTMGDFAPNGTSGKNLTAINTAMNHIDRLNSMVDQLDQYNFARGSMLNAPMNAVRGQMSPEYQGFEGHWNAAVTGVSGELAKVFRSTGMSERDIDEWRKSFDINSSPAKAKAAVNEALHLVDGRLDAIGESYNKGMRLNSAKPSLELLSPQARAIHEKLGGGNAPETRVGATSQTVPPQREREKGKVYVTPRGPMMWTGRDWEPAR